MGLKPPLVCLVRVMGAGVPNSLRYPGGGSAFIPYGTCSRCRRRPITRCPQTVPQPKKQSHGVLWHRGPRSCRNPNLPLPQPRSRGRPAHRLPTLASGVAEQKSNTFPRKPSWGLEETRGSLLLRP